MFWKKNTLNIPLPRLILYLVIVFSSPFIFLAMHYHKQKKSVDEICAKIYETQSLSLAKNRKQALNNLVRKVYKDPDPEYFNNLESLSFLGKEKKSLENLMLHPSFTGNESAEKRYNFIQNGRNRLQFLETAAQTSDGLTETAEVLAHPVELDSQDLRDILYQIEGGRFGKPLLFLTDFKLAKKAQSNGNEVFEINFKLLKREFVK